MIRCSAWVFDIDDTLYLERDYVRSGFEAVGHWAEVNLGVRGVAAQADLLFDAGRRRTTIVDALRDLGHPVAADRIDEIVSIYRQHLPRIGMIEDASVLIARLRSTKRIAVVTDGPPESQRNKVAALRLAQIAEPILLTEQLGVLFRKPGTGAFELIEHHLGLRGEDCIYVADNPAKDFAGPRKLGWQTLRVRRPRSLHVEVPSGGDVDLEVTSLADVPI